MSLFATITCYALIWSVIFVTFGLGFMIFADVWQTWSEKRRKQQNEIK